MAKLAEVKCTPMRFEPGDRLLVKYDQGLTPQQLSKLYNTVKKWAGRGVEILMIPKGMADLELQKKLR